LLRLKELREGKNMTQYELARALDVQPSRVGLWEQGRRSPRDNMKKALADFFGVTVDYLMGYTDENNAYYLDPEVEEYANAIHKEPSLKLLFDASRGLQKEDIDEVVNFVRYQKAKRAGVYDD